MESRITALEMKIEQQSKMQALQNEIEQIKNQQQFSELKWMINSILKNSNLNMNI